MKTTFDFNFGLNKGFKQHGRTDHANHDKLSIKKASLMKSMKMIVHARVRNY